MVICTVPDPEAVDVPHERQDTPVAKVPVLPEPHTISSVLGW
jgi:hypothetical protein